MCRSATAPLDVRAIVDDAGRRLWGLPFRVRFGILSGIPENTARRQGGRRMAESEVKERPMHPGKGQRRGRVTARGRQPSAQALDEVAALFGRPAAPGRHADRVPPPDPRPLPLHLRRPRGGPRRAHADGADRGLRGRHLLPSLRRAEGGRTDAAQAHRSGLREPDLRDVRRAQGLRGTRSGDGPERGPRPQGPLHGLLRPGTRRRRQPPPRLGDRSRRPSSTPSTRAITAPRSTPIRTLRPTARQAATRPWSAARRARSPSRR